jgi:hypothetical protein
MARLNAMAVGLVVFAAVPAARAAGGATYRQTDARASAPSSSEDRVVKSNEEDDRRRRDWTLSFEGVGNAPTDLGAQVLFETPFGLRLLGGYGFMPGASLAWLRGWTVSVGDARATINTADASGRILRLKAGIRPFSRLGLYLDGGYGRADLDATVDVTGSLQNVGSISGGYHAASALDLWLVELGYQWKIENRLVLGVGLGFMGTINARTTITPLGSANAAQAAMLTTAQTAVNGALEGYGFVPTLSLRVGFNVL